MIQVKNDAHDMQILIVSKLPIIRWGLIHVLQEFEQDFDFWETATEEETIKYLRNHSVDLLIIHAESDSGSVISLLSKAIETKGKSEIVILSNRQKSNWFPKQFEKSIKGIIDCAAEIPDIKRAFLRILNGEVHISHTFIHSAFKSDEIPGAALPHELLSVRELQVFFLLVKGESLKEIANQMFLSDKTISSYRLRILHKFKVKSNAELVRYAYKKNLMN